MPYRVTINFSDWNFDDGDHNPYLDVTRKLAQLLVNHPAIRVQMACGIYDLATPLAANQTVVQQLSTSGHASISMHTYPAGHMLYTSDTANRQFYQDSKQFYQTSRYCQSEK